jgi:hypothetical protein
VWPPRAPQCVTRRAVARTRACSTLLNNPDARAIKERGQLVSDSMVVELLLEALLLVNRAPRRQPRTAADPHSRRPAAQVPDGHHRRRLPAHQVPGGVHQEALRLHVGSAQEIRRVRPGGRGHLRFGPPLTPRAARARARARAARLRGRTSAGRSSTSLSSLLRSRSEQQQQCCLPDAPACLRAPPPRPVLLRELTPVPARRAGECGSADPARPGGARAQPHGGDDGRGREEGGSLHRSAPRARTVSAPRTREG